MEQITLLLKTFQFPTIWKKNKVWKKTRLGKKSRFLTTAYKAPSHLSNIISSLHSLHFRHVTISAPQTHQTQSYLTALALTAQSTFPLAFCMPIFFSSFGTQPAYYSCSEKCSQTISSIKESLTPPPRCSPIITLSYFLHSMSS